MVDASSESSKYLMRELRSILKEKLHGVTLMLNEDSFSQVEAEIVGPEETPYEGGGFVIRLVFGSDYPNTPPKGYFLTKIFHPNVSSKGDICVNAISKDWNKETGLKHLLVVIRCLLIEPNPESALNMEAGHLLLENYQEFFKRARMFTQVYARAKESTDAPRSQDSTKENVTSEEKSSSHSSGLSSTTTAGEKGTVSPTTLAMNASSGTGVGISTTTTTSFNNPIPVVVASSTTIPPQQQQMMMKSPFGSSKNDNSVGGGGVKEMISPKKKPEKKSLKRF